MRILAIRHLPTSWNLEGRLQGSIDNSILPINEEIEERIISQKERFDLQPGKFKNVFVSELQRTHQTAKAYGFEDFKIEPLINEMDFSEYEGKLKSNMIDELGENWFNDPYETRLGPEVIKLESRIEALLEKYKNEETLVLFSHGAFTRSLRSKIIQGNLKSMNNIELTPNSILELEI